jgi:hypothetical protein
LKTLKDELLGVEANWITSATVVDLGQERSGSRIDGKHVQTPSAVEVRFKVIEELVAVPAKELANGIATVIDGALLGAASLGRCPPIIGRFRLARKGLSRQLNGAEVRQQLLGQGLNVGHGAGI